MYIAVVLAQTVVLPLVTGAIAEVIQGGDPLLVFGRWFLFWAVGTRLLLAGVVQILRPGFTTSTILGAQKSGTDQVAQELGFTNASVGSVAVIAFFVPSWQEPVALIGGLFLGLAGIRHLGKAAANREELVATWTDLLVAAVMAVFIVASLLNG